MNTKQMSKIRNKAKGILVEWLKDLLNKETPIILIYHVIPHVM